MKCKDDSSERAFINTTLTYSSDTGDEIASTIAQKLYAETGVSSNGLKIGDNILIETVIFGNDSIQSPQNSPGKSLPTIGVAVLAVICLGIIFISYCVRYVLIACYTCKDTQKNITLQGGPPIHQILGGFCFVFPK